MLERSAGAMRQGHQVLTNQSALIHSGSSSSFFQAGIKNVLRQTEEDQSTSATKHYDAFGNDTTSSGTWQGPFQYGGNFGYQTAGCVRLVPDAQTA